MKSRIASDLSRSNLTSQIAEAIESAIAHYQPQRFWFNETRSLTFTTVAGQDTYSSSDDTDIPLFYDLEGLHLTANGHTDELTATRATVIETLLNNSTVNSVPTHYTRYAQSFRLYPPPAGAYTVRMVGHYKLAAPGADDEAGNPWMVEAERLVRSRAKALLATDPIRDDGLATRQTLREREALDILLRETASKTGTGYIEPSDF